MLLIYCIIGRYYFLSADHHRFISTNCKPVQSRVLNVHTKNIGNNHALAFITTISRALGNF